MAVREVYIPERKSPFASLFSKAQNVMGGVSMAKGIGGLFGAKEAGGGLFGGTTGAGTKAGEYTLGTSGSSYTPYAGPEALTYEGGAAAPTAPTGSAMSTPPPAGESMWASAGPIAVGAGSMAFGAQAEGDYLKRGSDAGNAKYSSGGRGPSIQNDSTKGWGYDAMSRRTDARKALDPTQLMEARKSLDMLPLSGEDKASMSKKLSQAFSFAKNIKIG